MKTALPDEPSHLESPPGRREMNFVPVVNPHPRWLTIRQVEEYNDRGYLAPLDVFDAEGVQSNREYFNSLLESRREKTTFANSYTLIHAHLKCAGVWDLVMNKTILNHVEDLIGPNLVMQGSLFWCKLPGDHRPISPHQDGVLWNLVRPGALTVWLAIDDVDEENGAVEFFPGSHRLGTSEIEMFSKLEQTDKYAAGEIVNVEQYGRPVVSPLKAGQISIHSDMVLHGSGPNLSARRRCGLGFCFLAPEIRSLDPEFSKTSSVARGVDTSDYWATHRRPPGEDVGGL